MVVTESKITISCTDNALVGKWITIKLTFEFEQVTNSESVVTIIVTPSK